VSIERDENRQAEARATISHLDLARYVNFVLADAELFLETAGQFEFALIDCEKADYVRFFDMLHMSAGGVVVADNIYSHSITDYVAHVRSRPDVDSITLPVGKGLEVTRFRAK